MIQNPCHSHWTWHSTVHVWIMFASYRVLIIFADNTQIMFKVPILKLLLGASFQVVIPQLVAGYKSVMGHHDPIIIQVGMDNQTWKKKQPNNPSCFQMHTSQPPHPWLKQKALARHAFPKLPGYFCSLSWTSTSALNKDLRVGWSNMGGSINGGTPKWMVFHGKSR